MTDSTADYTIRPATASDVVNITRLLKSAWADGPMQVLRVNEAKAIRWVMDSIDGAFILVADLTGRLFGTIAFVPVQPAWSDDWLMSRLWFYARPQLRTREKVLNDLLVAAETFMDQKRMVMRLDLDTDALMPRGFSSGLADRHGYTQIGTGALLRLPKPVERDEVSRLDIAEA